MGKITQYIFEGEAPVKCSKCGYTHTIYFSGAYPTTIRCAIEEALQSERWGVDSMTCPDCYDPMDEERAIDELIEQEFDEDWDDDAWEHGDYDEEWEE